MCIVGELTSMAIATGHKGKTAIELTCIGSAAYSALAPQAVNAIHLAYDLISQIRHLQDYLAANGTKDSAYDIPYTTLHAGLTGSNQRIKVAFGTEGGLFSQKLGISAVVCGPGLMAHEHKADEFVTVEQLAACDAMLAALIEWLEKGVGWSDLKISRHTIAWCRVRVERARHIIIHLRLIHIPRGCYCGDGAVFCPIAT